MRPAKLGDGALNVSQLEMKVDPRAEWADIFRESWRVQREYFYDAENAGCRLGCDLQEISSAVAYVGHRADLGYLIAQIGGELTVGHSYLRTRRHAGRRPVSVGLLGADIADRQWQIPHYDIFILAKIGIRN